MTIVWLCSIIKPICFWTTLGFRFELLNQKMFEMKILKMAHLTYFVIFNLKMIICSNVNLSHTYGHCIEKLNMW
jgi:hypothetical protein